MEVNKKICIVIIVMHVGVMLQTYASFTPLQFMLLARFQWCDPHIYTHTHRVSGSHDEDTAAASLLSRIRPEAPSFGQISH